MRGWQGHPSVQNVMDDLSDFIPVGGALVAMIVGGIDIMMLLSDWYFDRREKRLQTAKAEGIAEGKAEGIAEGKAEGIAEGKAAVYQEIADWDRRRREAAARGEEFTEPPPGISQNGDE